ncbi:MAG TPA: hypothetical protein VJ724_05705 [Tahibacter sp.]|nr:hypothetical protein [Tahibacter sp.]
MTSEVAIYNLALGRIGQSEVVSAPDERSKSAITCRRFYESVREFTLRDFAWGFATTAVPLAQIPLPAGKQQVMGYAYQYAYPTDCLYALAVCPETGVRFWMSQPCGWWSNVHDRPYAGLYGYTARAPFRVMRATSGAQALYTDLPEAYLMYVADITDTSQFDPLFVDVLAWRLAAEIAVPMVGSQVGVAIAQRMSQAYVSAKQNAMTQSANEQQQDPPPDSPTLAARW